MNRMTFRRRFIPHRFSVCVLLIVALTSGGQADDATLDFPHDVAPILKRHCVTCHGGREREGDFSINTRGDLIESQIIDLDSPDASHLIELITSDDPDAQMPPSDRARLSASEVAMLRRWIAEGLPWDAELTFAINSYEPPLKPRTPQLPAAVDGRNHPIDRILDAYLADNDLPRPVAIYDATFARRVHLDLTGLLPTPQRLQEFLADQDPDKRERLIDELLADRFAYAEHWLTFFNDLLRNDYSGTGFITGGRKQVSGWLYDALLANKPFDQMARELIAPPTAESRGYIDGIKWRGEVSAGQTLEIQFAQSLSQSFLGINMKCASCHDSFIDRWTLRDAYGLAAIYASRPLELHRCDKPTGQMAEAAWMFPVLGQIDPAAPRDERLKQLADLMTDTENGRFARTIVNRLWYRMMGRGIVHPLDAMQNKPWNIDLLDYLASDFIANGFDLKATLKRIATSQAYQSQTETVAQPESSETYVYRGPRARRMTAEQFLDAIWQLTDSGPEKFDAPVVRSNLEKDAIESIAMDGDWIWGASEVQPPAAGAEVALRKTITLPAGVAAGGAMLTCDNEFRLFINGRRVAAGDNWTRPQTVPLAKHLTKGENTLLVIAKNAGSSPNPAGLYFQAQITLDDGAVKRLKSDDSWQFSNALPKEAKGQLTDLPTQWQPAEVVPAVASWTSLIQAEGRMLLARVALGDGDLPPVRASLMKNTALMKSLGRPMREQIVSMRPDRLTTLEAIDLANDAALAESFAAGARLILQQPPQPTDALVRSLFLAALSRQPTEVEASLFAEAIGPQPSEASLQDALWAICMLPEFLLVR